MDKHLYVSRNCPLQITREDTEDVTLEQTSSSPPVARNRYFFSQVAEKKEKQIAELETQPEKKPPYVIKHGDFEFVECPIPIVSDNLMSREDKFANFVINMVNWSEQTGNTPTGEGILDQANVFYEARMVVLNEQNKIEKERHEQSMKEAEDKSKKHKSHTPARSRRR